MNDQLRTLPHVRRVRENRSSRFYKRLPARKSSNRRYARCRELMISPWDIARIGHGLGMKLQICSYGNRAILSQAGDKGPKSAAFGEAVRIRSMRLGVMSGFVVLVVLASTALSLPVTT